MKKAKESNAAAKNYYNLLKTKQGDPEYNSVTKLSADLNEIIRLYNQA